MSLIKVQPGDTGPVARNRWLIQELEIRLTELQELRDQVEHSSPVDPDDCEYYHGRVHGLTDAIDKLKIILREYKA